MGRIQYILILMLWAVSFASPASASATVLAESDSFYPADKEWLFIADLVGMISPNGARRSLENCANNQTRPFDVQVCEAAQILREFYIPADQMPWGKLNTQVIFFGELHPDQTIKSYLTKNLVNLKAQGVNALALEMFNSKNQNMIDQFLAGEISSADLKKTLDYEWNYHNEGYMLLLEEAKRLRLRIIALDDRDNTNDPRYFETVHKRDNHMAQIMASAIAKDPTLKIAVLCGRLHAYKVFSQEDRTRSLPAILRNQYGISTLSLLAFHTIEPNGFNSVQKVLFGEDVSSIAGVPEGYPYADYLLFLK